MAKRWPPPPGSLAAKLADFERGLIIVALQLHGGGIRAAARQLQMGPSHLLQRMKRLGIKVKVTAQVIDGEGEG